MLNLTNEINLAAEYLIEENDLISDRKEITEAINDWICGLLEEIDFAYEKDLILKRKVEKIEQKTAELESTHLRVSQTENAA